METHARGLICAPITKERAEELELPMMVTHNTSIHSTPFTVSIDLLTHGCTTGISAYDRAQTILALTRSETKPEDFGRPGHIFPLRAMSKGVIRRAGHTEATIDLARLAGLYPAGALAEIKKEDGDMARLPELMKMDEEFNLKIIRGRPDQVPPENGVARRPGRGGSPAHPLWRFPYGAFPAEVERTGPCGNYQGRMAEGRTDSGPRTLLLCNWRHFRLHALRMWRATP